MTPQERAEKLYMALFKTPARIPEHKEAFIQLAVVAFQEAYRHGQENVPRLHHDDPRNVGHPDTRP